MNCSQKLKSMIRSGGLVMPDAYDPLSAMLIEQAGFSAVQCSGYSMAIAAGGLDEDDLGPDRNLSVTRAIVQSVAVPVMADGEEGFGDIAGTVAAYVRAGAAGINLEDRIHHIPEVRVSDRESAAANIRSARAAAAEAGNPELVINARTDALMAGEDRRNGLKESIIRGNMFLEAGADMVFVTKVASLDEVETLVREIPGPVSIAAGLTYNIGSFSIRELLDRGVARVSLPAIAIMTVIAALRANLKNIRDTGTFRELTQNKSICGPGEINALMREKA
ncbi:MAG: oxaloacetate decarboxylase [Victivallaceae bacterium]|nr:isocitrate lyase/phosphoenolpyruvate mutase family protein [Victivallaceae bacterium]